MKLSHDEIDIFVFHYLPTYFGCCQLHKKKTSDEFLHENLIIYSLYPWVFDGFVPVKVFPAASF